MMFRKLIPTATVTRNGQTVPRYPATRGQSWLSSHAETIAQNVLGQILYFIVLLCFGVPMTLIGPLQAACFVVGYTRSYVIRRFFNWWHLRRGA